MSPWIIDQTNGAPPLYLGSREWWIPMNPPGTDSRMLSWINQYQQATTHRLGFNSEMIS
ncbi:unnamed protein product, partial [marine sediment metagenome]